MRRATSQAIGSSCQSCSARAPSATRTPFIRQSVYTSQHRATANRVAIPFGVRWASKSRAPKKAVKPTQSDPAAAASESTSLAPNPNQLRTPSELANSVNASFHAFTEGVSKVPDQALTAAALRACYQAAARLHPHLKTAEARAKGSASRLTLLGAERAGSTLPIDADVLTASNKISQTAYNVIVHPNVELSADALESYVTIQSLLGRSESLPSILELYAHKPKPEVKDGVVRYVSQNPNAASKAIEKGVADIALQTAIDAKNLDAALGITEAAFCVKAFKRQKLLKRGAPPAIALSTLPFGIVGLGAAYATYWQNTMDVTTAASLGVAGISGYFFVTGSLGLIAKLSHKDQMKRVTWLPGTPLRYRWMREEEREALDKIACAWGFRESWRYGEETGPDWEGLREYMGYRQMILDRVEFMEGMN